MTLEYSEDLVMYRALMGSRAYGLASASSDEDLRGVYLAPPDLLWSLKEVPEQFERSDGYREEVYWELAKFLKLALKANPTVLEILWSPFVQKTTPAGDALLAVRESFLSKKVHDTYRRYVESQMTKLERYNEKNGTYKPKHAMHLTRLLLAGLHTLRTGKVMVDVGDHREELLAIKAGDVPLADVLARADTLASQYDEALASTPLPDEPDVATLDRFLIEARRSSVD